MDDNPALRAAVARGGAVVPVFIWSPQEEGGWNAGAASRWWLHHSLQALDEALRACCSRLVIRRGETLAELRAVIRRCGADAVFYNRRYEPAAVARDREVEVRLREAGVRGEACAANLLTDPTELRTRQGKPFQVYTAFWRASGEMSAPAQPLAAPRELRPPARWPASVPLERLGLLPKVGWASGIEAAWKPGAVEAARQLRKFLGGAIDRYHIARDRPDLPGTSRLSAHLHFGEISPRTVWHAVQRRAGRRGKRLGPGAQTFLKEIYWREFSHYLLYHFPQTVDQPLRPEFGRFPWVSDDRALVAWQRGRTGYPLVDAGMRELWSTGWMHNRVRMVVASLLVKDLLISWQAGARWFWDTLVDADLANNTLGWQWTAGCGADAAPYFRIFNPVAQGERYDPRGDYVRRWVPELAGLPDRWIHQPWNAPAEILRDAEVRLGKTYPAPIVDHGEARERALGAFKGLRRG